MPFARHVDGDSMDSRTRVYVFDRIELALLVFFFVAMSVGSFVLGVRFGKKQALDNVGITEEQVKEVELKSDKEEYVEKSLDQAAPQAMEQSAETEGVPRPGMNEEGSTDIDEQAFQKLQDEFEKLDQQNFKPKAAGSENKGPDINSEPKPSNDLIGKYTIQLGSYKTMEEAQQFAEGFIARGYKPIILDVELPNRGRWYRVSLGTFDDPLQAKQYISAEKSLFADQDYVITEIE